MSNVSLTAVNGANAAVYCVLVSRVGSFWSTTKDKYQDKKRKNPVTRSAILAVLKKGCSAQISPNML